MHIRKIEKSDNILIASVIRKTLEEFNMAKPGTVYTDPSTDHLFELFQKENSCFYVAEENNEILGSCGIYPTEGLPEGCAELVKFYVDKKVRGTGIGKELMNRCFQWAMENNYSQLYLESAPELEKAVGMYEKAGFKKLDHALGNSGHFSCTIWMLKTL